LFNGGNVEWPVRHTVQNNSGAIVRLVNIFNCHAMMECSKMNERLPDMTPHGVLLDVSVSTKKVIKNQKSNINYSRQVAEFRPAF
jgi:hypothetical protein